MPLRIPVAENDVQVQTGSTGRLQAADAGPGIGAGLKALGAGLDQAAQNVHDIHVGAAKQLDNEYVAGSDAILHTGENAYLGQSGANAILSRASTEQALTKLRDDILSKATSRDTRAMIEPMLTERSQMDMRAVGDHANQQGKIYDTEQSTARVGLQAATAGNNYLDPEKSEAAISTLSGEYDNLAKLKGWSPEETEFQRQTGVSGARKDIANRLIYASPQGPQMAQAYLDKFSSQFTSDDAAAVQSGIRTYQNHLDAEARAAAAEQRRQQAQAESDARNRVEDGLHILETGTPLPPQQIASLENDARHAGKSADTLTFRVKQASFKNGLNVEYNSATPAQIGARVDELGARIAAAGDKADMQDVVEFHHLKQMQATSASDLRNSALHWGAQHLGIQIGALNLTDPNSVNSRITAARSIAARTGTPPQFLTPEEAASMAPTWQNGTAQDRVGLVQRLAKLGAAGSLAARQVAPNDPMLATVVGLANVPNAAVAADKVQAIMAGPEVIKAHKSLVGGVGVPAQMAQTYDSTVGGALRLLPQADAGTRAAAMNYFAGKMASQGVYDWNHASGQWPNAINSALGAYNDHGVLRGGLGKHSDATTILPTGVSQQEFDTAIARAPHTAFGMDTAGNGQPVWADGHPLTAGEVKRAQFVPVGDGRYALFSNGGYVQRKAGGRYEIDWRKLP